MRFVVRQPIFDGNEHVVGYELKLEDAEAGEACCETVELALLALERIPPGSLSTLHCNRMLLESIDVRALPADRATLALEPAEVSECLPFIAALREAGYHFTLLDYDSPGGVDRHLSLFDSIGLRMGSEIESSYRRLRSLVGSRVPLIAREVASRADWQLVSQIGFRLFHGEYFLTPAKKLAQDVPSSKLACLQLLKELRRPVLDYGSLEILIKREPSFCYRLLRYLNSAAFFGKQKVTSIRHAMAMLGDDELRRWFSLMATVAASEGKPSEIVVTAMLRARLCEILAKRAPDDGFMAGLFSLMPLIVNMQLGALLSLVHLPREVDAALWGEPGALRTVLNLAVAFERAQWEVVRTLAGELGISAEDVFAARGEASRWTNEILSAQAEPVSAV